MKAPSLNHWTAREFPVTNSINSKVYCLFCGCKVSNNSSKSNSSSLKLLQTSFCKYLRGISLLFVIIILEKAMAPHSSTLAWKIPWMEEPGGLKSIGSLRVGHDRATSLSLFTFMHWRRKWQPTPVFLPGESHGRRSLVGCCLWGRTELDTAEAT